MTDRTSTITVGIFQISVDRDHRGNFRGHEAMDERYHGCHYHVVAERDEEMIFTPEQVMVLLEQCLLNEGAKPVDPPEHLSIGNIEKAPSSVACYEKDGLQSVLWISSKTGTLHVETNKDTTFKPGLVTKSMLVQFCKDITRYYSACSTFERLFDRLERLGICQCQLRHDIHECDQCSDRE